MTSFDSYNARTTSISYPWPSEVNGIERVACSAQGDLQRVLSAFFGKPIGVTTVYSNTSTFDADSKTYIPLTTAPTATIISSASPSNPIIQTRQVHLLCEGRIVCTATSTVKITSSEAAHLFLQEKYAIGQMFRRSGRVPDFLLKVVGLGDVKDTDSKEVKESQYTGSMNQLWRKYTLAMPHFECDILEVFPERRMFTLGESWLEDKALGAVAQGKAGATDSGLLSTGLKLAVGGSVLFIAAVEGAKLMSPSRAC